MQASIRTSKASALFARHPELKVRFDQLRRIAGHMHPSQYDVSDMCNLKCEGCLYFMGNDRYGAQEVVSLDMVDRFFAAEAERGVNFAQLGGAEPALSPDRLKIIAKHIPRGLIFTNGTIPIDQEIRYRLHISVWGGDDGERILRGANSFKKSLALYTGDDRAVFVLTINRHNLDSVLQVARLCNDAGVKLSFNHFSPTEKYVGQPLLNYADYSRLAGEGHAPILGADDLVRAHREIVAAMDAYPDTVVYSAFFNDWIHRPEGLYRLNDQGIAVDCGSRVTARYRHFRVDMRDSGDVKCCAPNLSCRTCRIYAQSLATALHRFDSFTGSKADFLGWIEMYEFWIKLFLLNVDSLTNEFGQADEMIAELAKPQFVGQKSSAPRHGERQANRLKQCASAA